MTMHRLNADPGLSGRRAHCTTITYDALDRQVEQDNAGTYTQTVYDPMGSRLANMASIKTLNTAPVLLPAGGQAVYVGALDYYKHADWEGSR